MPGKLQDGSVITGALQAIVIGLMLLGGVRKPHSAALAEPPYPRTNLISFLAKWNPDGAVLGSVYTLEPEWVGTADRVYLRGGEAVYKDDKSYDIRFSHLRVGKDNHDRTNLAIVRGRIGAGGLFSDHHAVFMSNLPSAKAVSEAKNGEDLRKVFGPQHGFTDGWGGNGGIHWTEGWTWLTLESTNRLRYLGVFAHLSSSSSQSEKPPEIDILRVTEGFFRPADANSAAEKKQFKTGEEAKAEYEAGQAKARVKYPLPLRALVEARETPDMVAYKRALNEVRRNPSPELFRQFAEWMHEGTCEIKGMLTYVLFDDWLKLEKWAEPQRKVALRALVDALPHVKTSMDLDDLAVFILQARGGGELKIQVPGTSARIDLKTDGHKGFTSYGSQNVGTENLSRVAAECQRVLKERYPELR
jgi:hypothetical protein